MATSHSAATAAALAIDDRTSVQKVSQDKLLTDKQVLEWQVAR